MCLYAVLIYFLVFYILRYTCSLDHVGKVLGVTKSYEQVQLDFWISLPMYFDKIALVV